MEPVRSTFPGISPVLLSCWLLAFTLWLDDLVIGSSVTGLWRRLCRLHLFACLPLCRARSQCTRDIVLRCPFRGGVTRPSA